MHKTGAVTFNIPQGQSFESTSITGFKGIQYSDNPLAVDQNSAADMLNVYLSDSGTLTTRPRIEYEKGKPSANWDEVINRIKLADDLVLYQVKEVEVVDNQSVDKINLYKYSGTTLTKINLQGVIISSNKISAFYKDEKIYVLDSKYYVIKSDNKLYFVENDSDTYTPITRVGESSLITTVNLLNDRYTERYLWNEHQDLSKYVNAYNTKKIENKYYIEKPNRVLTGGNNDFIYFPDNTYADTITNTISTTYRSSTTELRWYKLDSTTYMTTTLQAKKVLDISLNKRYIFYLDSVNYNDNYTETIGVYDRNTYIAYEFTEPTVSIARAAPIISAQITNDSKFVFVERSGYFHIYRVTLSVENEEPKLTLVLVKSFPVGTHQNENLSSPFFKKSDGLTVSFIYKDNTEEKYYKTTAVCDGAECVDSTAEITLNTKDVPLKANSNLTYYLSKSDDYYILYDANFLTAKTIQPPVALSEDSLFVDIYGNVILSNNTTTYQCLSDNFKIYEHSKNYWKIVSNHYTSSMYGIKRQGEGTETSQYVYDLTFIEFIESTQPDFYITYKRDVTEITNISITNVFRFQNNYWFYGNGNRLWRTSLNDPTYIEEYNYIDVGNDDRITGINVISDNLIAAYKDNSFYLITRTEISDGNYVYTCTETKGEVGNLPIGQTTTTKYSELPLSIDDSGIFYISQLKNVTLSEHNTTSVSSLIDKKFLAEPNKKSIITHNHRYWTYFIFPGNTAKVYVYDNRTNEWYYWELPNGNIISLWEENETADNGDMFIVTKYMTSDGKTYALRTTDKIVRIDADNEDDYYSVYLDSFSNGTQEIEWFWESQILPLTYTRYSKSYPALGYRKQLTQTGFLFTDTDENEEYSLDYSFKVYRKALSAVPEQSISGTLNRVRSILRKTYIPRINFLQVKIKNSDLSYIHQTNLPNTHNKLNLIQLKFKYKLMEETV